MTTREQRQLVDDARQRQEAADIARSEYRAGLDAASRNNRFLRRRTGLGGAGDARLNATQLWFVRETVRHMELNDLLPGQALTRLTDLLMSPPFRVEPDTSDETLDQELAARWREWAENKLACDFYQSRTFDQLAWLHLYRTFVDGDVFPVLTDEGSIQTVEADCCVSPVALATRDETKARTVLGVELDAAGRPVAYWFAKSPPFGGYAANAAKLTRRPIRNERGMQTTLHCHGSKRTTQHRGYTLWLPLIVKSGMLDDVDFAMLLKSQASAAITGVATREPDGDASPLAVGPETTATNSDGASETTFKVKPAAIMDLPAGRDFKGWSSPVPNTEHLRYIRHELTELGAGLALPYCMLLLDASQTNFSGFRGAQNSARDTWVRLQADHVTQFHSPVYRWQCARWLPDLRSATAYRLASQGLLSRHRWIPGGWRYLNPLQDATADALTIARVLNSPRGVLAERGREFPTVARERTDDYGLLIDLALAKAQALRQKYPEADVTWRDVLHPVAQNISLSGSLDEDATSPQQTRTEES